MTTVTTSTDNALFHCQPGRQAEVLREFWRNGESWYRLRDTTTGERFDSPDTLWTEENPHDCWQHPEPYTDSGGPLGHGFVCGICGDLLQVG